MNSYLIIGEFMNKTIKLVAILASLTLATQAWAFFGFGFNFCPQRPVMVCRQPVVVYEPTCCHQTTYVAQPVHVVHRAPIEPSVQVGFGFPLDGYGSGMGLGFSIPLGGCSKPALLDDADQTYWQIYNDTDAIICVTNSGNSKKIRPGKTGTLKHRKNFNLMVEIDELDLSRMVTRDSHSLVVSMDQTGKIQVDVA